MNVVPVVILANPDQPKTALRRLDDVVSDRHVISIDQTEYGNVLAVSYDDSSITFYDPKTMTVFDGVDDANTVTSLAQAGYHYPLDPSGSSSKLEETPRSRLPQHYIQAFHQMPALLWGWTARGRHISG